jgi:cation transport ATPase
VLLSVLAVIAAVTSDWNSVTLIAAMVSISVGISFVQERRALISALALSKRITHRVRVRRPAGFDSAVAIAAGGASHARNGAKVHGGYEALGGDAAAKKPSSSSDSVLSTHLSGAAAPAGAAYRIEEIPSHELVPGDIVLLSAGSLVPADLRLLSCTQLLIKSVAQTCNARLVSLALKRYICSPRIFLSVYLFFVCLFVCAAAKRF